MKDANTRDWLVDSLIVLGVAYFGVILLPWVEGWFGALSLHLGRKLFWLHFVALGHFLPYVLVGCFLGLAAAGIIRHRRLLVALLPAVLLCEFFLLYGTFGPYPYRWGSWYDLVTIVSWLLLILASLLSARFVLRRLNSS